MNFRSRFCLIVSCFFILLKTKWYTASWLATHISTTVNDDQVTRHFYIFFWFKQITEKKLFSDVCLCAVCPVFDSVRVCELREQSGFFSLIFWKEKRTFGVCVLTVFSAQKVLCIGRQLFIRWKGRRVSPSSKTKISPLACFIFICFLSFSSFHDFPMTKGQKVTFVVNQHHQPASCCCCCCCPSAGKRQQTTGQQATEFPANRHLVIDGEFVVTFNCLSSSKRNNFAICLNHFYRTWFKKAKILNSTQN